MKPFFISPTLFKYNKCPTGYKVIANPALNITD